MQHCCLPSSAICKFHSSSDDLNVLHVVPSCQRSFSLLLKIGFLSHGHQLSECWC